MNISIRCICMAFTILLFSSTVRLLADQPAPTQGLSFYLPFDNGLKSIIGTQPEPASQKGAPLFVAGKTGQALREGARDGYLLYRAEGNMNGQEGTASIWIRPQWDKNDPHFHTFWNLHGDGRFILYCPNGKNLIFLYRGKGLTDQQYTTLIAPIDAWKPGEWHNVAATWRAGEVCLYVDGELARKVVNPNLILPEVNKNSVFFIGDSYYAGYGIQKGMSGVADTDLDEFRLYTRVLDSKEIHALAGKEDMQATPPSPPFVVVPKTSQPPKIDGAFSFDQWKDAAGFTGFVNLSNGGVSDRQTAVLLCYDDKNLYIATFAPLPNGAPLKSVVDRRDGPTYGDDSIEIYLDPDNARRAGQFVQFVGNSTGYYLDLKNGDSGWNGDWNYKSAIQGNWRGFGQTYWVTQMAVPFQTLGRGTPVNGEKWAANFARTWYTPNQEFTSWAWNDKITYGTPARFGTLQFEEHAPAFEWTTLRDFTTGQPALEGSSHASSPGVHLQVAGAASGQKFIDKDLSSDSQTSQYWLNQIDLGGDLQDTLKVKATSGANVLYSAEIPYQLETQPVRVIVSAVPSQELLIVDADPLRYRKEWEDGGNMKVCLMDNAGKIFDTKTLAPPEKLPARAELSLHNVPPGNYRVQVTMQDKTGKTLATQNSAFTKPPTPVWFNNKIGITDKVPKPWTPIICNPNDLKMWARDYHFDDNALPQQVTSAGENLLQAPAQLMIDGKALTGSSTNTNEKTDARVVRSGTARSGNWKINWKCTAEYDGMLWYEVTLAPPVGKSATLNSLALELPLRPETSGLYNASNGSYGLGGGESGPTPASWNSGWKQVFWLGDEKAGLCWFAESDQYWNLKDPHDAIRFTRDAKNTLARVQFVTAPMEVSQPITYKFGLQATPTRPMPVGWRGWQWASRGLDSIKADAPFHPTNATSWWQEWSPYISSPLDIKPDAASKVAQYHQAGIKVIPYQALLALNEKAPDFDYFKTEWLNQPQMNAGGEAGQQTWFVNVKGSYQDYFLYALQQEIHNQHWDGLYFDFAQGAVPDRNQFHGSGYVDDKGVRHPTYDLLAQREFFKRLWVMLQQETGNDEPIVMIHDSACVVPPVDSFANVYFDGEQFLFSPKVDDDYTKVLSRDSYRAEFLGSNFGGVPLLLTELNTLQIKWMSAKTEPEKTIARQHFDAAIDTMLLYPLTHGTLFTPNWMDMEYIQPLLVARHEFNMSTARFYGYWENQNLVTLSPNNPNVLASIYAHDDRLWLEIGNWTDSEQAVTATLDLAKISPHLNAATAVSKNIWKDGIVTHEGNTYHFSVPPKSARIIEITN